MKAARAGGLLSLCGFVLLLAAACGEDELPAGEFKDFDAFALEIADAMTVGEVERVMFQTARETFACEGKLLQEAKPCRGAAPGTKAQGFALKLAGKETIFLDSDEIRLMLEGIVFGADGGASPDRFGPSRFQVYSTLYPDRQLWFASDRPDALPERGEIVFTYIGRSPREDAEIKRRLWGSLAQKDSAGNWRIRLWLGGFFQADHPALNPSPQNGFKRWQP